MYAFQIPFQKLAGQLEKVMLPPLVRLSMKSGMFNCRRGIIKGICMHVMLSPKDMALIQVTEVLPWVIQVSMYIGIPYQMLTCKIGMIPACLRCNSGRPKYISRPCLTKNPGTRWKQNRVNWHIYLAKIYGRKYTGDRESNLYGAQTDKESRFDLPPWNDKESSSSEWSSKLYKEVLTDKNLVDKVRELNKQAERWVTRVLKWLRIRRWSYQTLIWCYHTKSALTPSWFKFLPPLAIHTPSCSSSLFHQLYTMWVPILLQSFWCSKDLTPHCPCCEGLDSLVGLSPKQFDSLSLLFCLCNTSQQHSG